MIGIICAMQIEADGILALCKDKKTSQKYGMTFTEGTLNGKEVVVVVCGVGKVNASCCLRSWQGKRGNVYRNAHQQL